MRYLAIEVGAAFASSAIASTVPPQIIKAAVAEKDYSSDAKAQGIEGDADVSFTIGLDGKVNNCTAINAQANALLVNGSCKVVSRWRFRPAKDETGKKVEDKVVQPFSWRIYSPCKQTAEPNRICVNLERKR